NRRLFIERLEQALEIAKQRQGYGALLVVDLDDFKTLNDTEGYHAGDHMLEQVATRLIRCVPHKDAVARLGGDEFVVLLEHLSQHELEAARQAEQLGQQILQELTRPYQLGPNVYRGTARIGIAFFGGRFPISSVEPLKRAQLAMSQAKGSNNAIAFFDPQMQSQVRGRRESGAALLVASEQPPFRLPYQTQGDDRVELIGVEALVRWAHPPQGMMSPARFIPVAEDNCLILPIGQWVLKTACRQLTQWAGDDAAAHLTIAVNIS